ncbi:hypothetical protein BC332_10930 [Capsicum chinense]|nr:hypothetical protein BC332_10930 [Capsicum chinense]
MPFFLTLWSVQTLSDPKVIDGIKIKLFGAITIRRKTILEGVLIVVDDGSGSGAVVGDNDAPLTVFETTNCKAKHDRVINAINALTASVKEITSKRGVIPSKKISYPYTPLEIKVAKSRRKNISKASLSIEKSKITMPLPLSCTVVQYERAIGEQNELKKSEVSQNEECLINIIKVFSIPAGLPWHLVDKVYIPINYGDKFHLVLVVVVLKERRIRVYYSMSRRSPSGPSSEIQNLAKILPTYLDMSNLSTIEAYRDKMDNPFDVPYVKGIAQQTIGSL